MHVLPLFSLADFHFLEQFARVAFKPIQPLPPYHTIPLLISFFIPVSFLENFHISPQCLWSRRLSKGFHFLWSLWSVALNFLFERSSPVEPFDSQQALLTPTLSYSYCQIFDYPSTQLFHLKSWLVSSSKIFALLVGSILHLTFLEIARALP